MTARIVLIGATGYTGRLTGEALVRRGHRPLLAGRSPEKLKRLAEHLGGGVEVAEADVEQPEFLLDLVTPGDVLLSTVGPFARWGDAAVEAALRRGAHYIDSNGEPSFTRRVLDRHGPFATRAGIAMLTAFGWECVLGNLAAAVCWPC